MFLQAAVPSAYAGRRIGQRKPFAAHCLQDGVRGRERPHDDGALIPQFVRRNRSAIQDAHADFENRVVDWLRHHFDRTTDRILPAHQHGADLPVIAPNRLDCVRRRKLEFLRRLPRFAHRESG